MMATDLTSNVRARAAAGMMRSVETGVLSVKMLFLHLNALSPNVYHVSADDVIVRQGTVGRSASERPVVCVDETTVHVLTATWQSSLSRVDPQRS